MVLRTKLFFESAPSQQAGRGRLCLFSYHFPPDPATGALRWQKLAVHAARRGFGLDVLMRDPSELENPDPSRLEDLPPGVRVFGVRQPEIPIERLQQWLLRYLKGRRARPSQAPEGPVTPADSAGKSSFTREELRFDPLSPRSYVRSLHGWEVYASHRAWARRAARSARQFFDPAEHRVVVSCGPPHGAHEAARLLSRATGVPFVIDLRDPWSRLDRWNEPVASPTTPWLAQRHERAAVSQAARIVMNTEPARAMMQELYPDHADRIIAVMNGFDEDDVLPNPQRDSCFRLAYAGSVYLDRDPRTLFEAAARVIREFELSSEEFAIEFMGPTAQLDGATIESRARDCAVEAYVTTLPSGTRREAAEFSARARVLVNLPQDSHLAIPSKIFEYMRFPAWLLGLAEPGSATHTVLLEAGADVAAPNDVDAIAALLRKRYLQHRNGEVPEPLASNPRLSRRGQAEILFDEIDRVLGHTPGVADAR